MRVEFTIYPASPSMLYSTESLTPADWKPLMKVESMIEKALVVSVEVGGKPREYFKAELAPGVNA